MVVLYFSDCDPSGWNMAVEVGRKLQAFNFAAQCTALKDSKAYRCRE
jgi:hypothetical protein